MQTKQTSGRGNRRPEFLEVARKLFFEKGYAGTTIEQVARDAGFSKRTVYLYFHNKDELFLTVGEEGILMIREQLEAIPVNEQPVEASVADVLSIYLNFAREFPEYFRIIFKESTPEMIKSIPEELRLRLEQHERGCLAVPVSIAKRAREEGLIGDVDPMEVASAFWGAATGIILLSMGGSQTVFSRSSREDLVEKAIWLIFAGLQQTREEG